LKTGFKVLVFENDAVKRYLIHVNYKDANLWKWWHHAHTYYVFSKCAQTHSGFRCFRGSMWTWIIFKIIVVCTRKHANENLSILVHRCRAYIYVYLCAVQLLLHQNLWLQTKSLIFNIYYWIKVIKIYIYILSLPLTEFSGFKCFHWCMVGGATTHFLKEYRTSGWNSGFTVKLKQKQAIALITYIRRYICKIMWSSSIKQHLKKNCQTLPN